MVKRVRISEQEEHDFIVEASADTYRKKGRKTCTNPNGEKNCEIEGYYPDVIVHDAMGVDTIDEIETESTVTENECKTQWVPYSKLGHISKLIVPYNSIETAKRIMQRFQLEAILQGYVIRGNKVEWYSSSQKHYGRLYTS